MKEDWFVLIITWKWVKLFFVSVFIVQGYCFNSSVYITLPVYEREQKLKYYLYLYA